MLDPMESDAENEHALDPVIKIYAVQTCPNYFLPWQMKPSSEMTGSGFAIEGRQIITNAHVVAGSTHVSVRKFGSPKKFTADIRAIGHDCDLAVLTVEDTSFWENLSPLTFGDLPHLEDTVQVVGYPTGGDNISVTRGVVSRVEPQQYAHGFRSLLAIQIDAAINPGNSGGPALIDNKVVGVAFQSYHAHGTENIGYLIPVPIISLFLQALKLKGGYNGFGMMGVQCQPMDSPQLRNFFSMEGDMSGVLITKIFPLTHAAEVLLKDDVILEVDGIPVANDGTISFRHRERLPFDILYASKLENEPVALTIWRNKQVHQVNVRLVSMKSLIPFHLKPDQMPSFFIHGGLVFTQVVYPYLLEWGPDWESDAPRKLVNRLFYDHLVKEDDEVIVLSNILVSDVNFGYSHLKNIELKAVNGQAVCNMKTLKRLVYENTEAYLRFDMEDGSVIILDAQQARESEPEILKKYHVPHPFSADLA